MGTQSSVSAGNGAPTPMANPIMSYVPMIVVIAILYMLIIRPQQKQAKEMKKMVDALTTGDKVLTQGGLYGVVSGLRGPVVQLKISDNVKVDVNRSAITEVFKDADPTNPMTVLDGNPG